jgi:hypothetical protein
MGVVLTWTAALSMAGKMAGEVMMGIRSQKKNKMDKKKRGRIMDFPNKREERAL